MLFDSHCHLNFSVFKNNYEKIIADCLQKGIGLVIIGSQYETSRRAVAIAEEYPNQPVYASIGLHPIHLSHTEVDLVNGFADGAGEEEIKFRSREEKFEPEKYQELINNDKNKKIVAIGETGLDYFHKPTINSQQLTNKQNWKDKQKQGFVAQLEFASKNNLPIILHVRGSKENPVDAYEDLLGILKLHVTRYHENPDKSGHGAGGLQVTGILHCFGPTLKIAKKFLNLGFYLGFTGIITFKNKSVDELRKVVKYIPLDRILVETDAPYLAPEPYRGQKCLPQYVEFVARKVAEIKNVNYEKVCEQTTGNVRKLFSLKH